MPPSIRAISKRLCSTPLADGSIPFVRMQQLWEMAEGLPRKKVRVIDLNALDEVRWFSERMNKLPTCRAGKFAFRIQFDGPLNELMQGKNAAAKGGIYSETIESLTVVSLPSKKVVADLTDAAFEGGNHFEEITFLWSADSKWCAFYFTYPRVGYTVALHLRGGNLPAPTLPTNSRIGSRCAG